MHFCVKIGACALVLIACAAVGHAATIVDDHFTGNSGGTPADWTIPSNVSDGTVVESGTMVTMSATGEESIGIVSDATYSPQGVVTTVVVSATLTSDAHLIFGIADGAPISQFLIADVGGDGSVRLTGANNFDDDHPEYGGSNIPGFAGGAIEATFVFDDDSFSLSTDVGGYSTGDISYASVPLTGFSFSGLGTSMRPVLAAGDESGTTAIDRIIVTTAVPEPAAFVLGSLGAVGVLMLRRRREGSTRTA